jgi:transcriptional regulator with XRE-family HTH domain
LFSEGLTRKSLAALFGVTRENIGNILRGKTWKHV